MPHPSGHRAAAARPAASASLYPLYESRARIMAAAGRFLLKVTLVQWHEASVPTSSSSDTQHECGILHEAQPAPRPASADRTIQGRRCLRCLPWKLLNTVIVGAGDVHCAPGIDSESAGMVELAGV